MRCPGANRHDVGVEKIIATQQTSHASGAVVIGRYPCCSNLLGLTQVLQLE
jgi:hypothetical protein